MNQKLLALYGLKWNPFSPELPNEAIYVTPKIENVCWRIEHAHAAGNYRILTTMATELLAAAAQRDLPALDEKLHLDVFAPPVQPTCARPLTSH